MTTILVVDDSPVDRRMACTLLEEGHRWQVLSAESGEDALAVIESQPVDLVVTDLLMAPMNGLGLIQEMLRTHANVPVVIMTSLGNDALAVQALRCGAASYVAKRSLAADLAETVTQILTLQSARGSQADVRSLIVRSETTYLLRNDIDQIQSLIAHLNDSVDRDKLQASDQRMPSVAFSEAERLRLNMALYEALLNAMRHGNLEIDSSLDAEAALLVAAARRNEPPYKFRDIQVRVTLTATEATYVIRDEGPGFDYRRHLLDENDSLDDRSGRGIALMQTIMDEVRFNDRGNEVTLIKAR